MVAGRETAGPDGGGNSNSNSDSNSENSGRDGLSFVARHHDPEQWPHLVLVGPEANLSALRGTDEQTRWTFFEERNRVLSPSLPEGLGPLVMESSLSVNATVASPSSTGEAETDGESDPAELSTTTVSGEVFVTNRQVLFVATDPDESSSDLAIGAACIVLHAMAEEPVPGVYLQLSAESGSGSTPPAEVTLAPIPGGNGGGGDAGDPFQELFDALCRLVSLHPLEPDSGDDGGLFGAGGVIGGGFGDDGAADYGEHDGFVWAGGDSLAASAVPAGSPEREAMLDHLDRLLVVPPGLEVGEDGQFDDAADETP